MAIQIKEKNGVFIIEGSLKTKAALAFKNHINLLLKNYSDVIVNIEKVSEIDETGLWILRQLFDNYKLVGCSFSIIGHNCHEINDDLKVSHAA